MFDSEGRVYRSYPLFVAILENGKDNGINQKRCAF